MATHLRLRSLVALGLALSSVVACAASPDPVDDETASTQSSATARCAAGELDLAAYVLPSCSEASAPRKGIDGDLLRTFPIASTDERGHFVVLKSSDGKGLEEWSVDREWLRIYKDTTWAFNPDKQGREWCDVQCSMGNEIDGQCKKRWNGDQGSWAYTVYRDDDGTPGAKWLPRCAKSGKSYTTTFKVDADHADSCTQCDTNLSGAASHVVSITRLATWEQYFDVVSVRVTDGAGKGESYFYARGKGWVGFHDRAHADEIHDAADVRPTHPCEPFAPASICSSL